MHEDVRCCRPDLVHQSRPVRSFTPAEPESGMLVMVVRLSQEVQFTPHRLSSRESVVAGLKELNLEPSKRTVLA